MTMLYLVRHGETAYNQKGVYYGWTDCPLSSTGVSQAHRLGEVLEGIDFQAVVSSPLIRARDTASLVGRRIPDEIVFDERLKELNFGSWEGMHYREIKTLYQDEWEMWTNDWQNFVIPGGESFLEMYRRVESVLEWLLKEYPEKSVLVVSHHSCLRVIMSLLLKMDSAAYWYFNFEQGRYSLVEVQDGFPVVKKINA